MKRQTKRQNIVGIVSIKLKTMFGLMRTIADEQVGQADVLYAIRREIDAIRGLVTIAKNGADRLADVEVNIPDQSNPAYLRGFTRGYTDRMHEEDAMKLAIAHVKAGGKPQFEDG